MHGVRKHLKTKKQQLIFYSQKPRNAPIYSTKLFSPNINAHIRYFICIYYISTHLVILPLI